MTGAILDHLWQSSVVALLIGALTLLFRNNSAGVRHGLWFAASVKFLFPFSLLTLLGRALFTHAVADSSIKMMGRIETVAVPFAAGAPIPLGPAQHQLSWTLIAAAVWALGFTAIVALWFVQWARLAKIVRFAKLAPLNTPVPVRVTTERLEPGLVGIMNPVILLPDLMARRLESQEIDAIFAHELCHLRRRDNLLTLIHMLVEALFWFHPLVWFIGARLAEESERACDESVLDTNEKPLDYAETILKVCRLTFRQRLPCASGISGADLDRRITAIMTRRRIDDVEPNKMLLLAGFGLFSVVTPFVSGGLVPAPTALMTPSSARMLAIVEQVARPTPPKPEVSWPEPQRLIHRPVRIPPPPMTMVAPPAIQAQIPIVIVAEPQLPAESNTSAIGDAVHDADTLVCRRPQPLPESRFMGPRVCLSRQMWDEYRSKGLVLMPDGRTVGPSFDQTRRPIPIVCTSMQITASNATNGITNCRL